MNSDPFALVCSEAIKHLITLLGPFSQNWGRRKDALGVRDSVRHTTLNSSLFRDKHRDAAIFCPAFRSRVGGHRTGLPVSPGFEPIRCNA
jgi:hypothetical protein